MKPETRQILSAISISYASFGVGLVLAYPGLVFEQWKREGKQILSTMEVSWFASIAQLMAIPGSLLGGYLTEKFGARRLILTTLPVFAAIWILTIQVTYHNPLILIILRGIQGVISAILCIPTFVYPCEIADTRRRGFLGTFLSCMFSSAYLITYTIGGITNWQIFSYVCIVITVLPTFLGTYLAVESPIWLSRRGDLYKAKKTLELIRSQSICSASNKELLSFESTGNLDKNRLKINRHKPTFHFWYPLLISICIITLKEMSGPFAISVFTIQIFQELETTLSPYWQSIVIGITRLLSNIICSGLMKRVKRKTMVIIPSLIATILMLIFGMFYAYKEDIILVENLRYLPLICLFLTVVCFGIGIDPVVALISAEIQPSVVRCYGVGFVQATFSLSSWMSTYLFVYVSNTFGMQFCFWIFSFGCFLTAIFVHAAVPETSQKTLSEIEDHWKDTKHSWERIKCKLSCGKSQNVDTNI